MIMFLLIAGLLQSESAASGGITPPPVYTRAATAFGQCIGDASVSFPQKIDPATVAQRAIAACEAKRLALDAQLVAWVDGPSYPAYKRGEAHATYDQSMANLQDNIVIAVRKRRLAEGAPFSWAVPLFPTS